MTFGQTSGQQGPATTARDKPPQGVSLVCSSLSSVSPFPHSVGFQQLEGLRWTEFVIS